MSATKYSVVTIEAAENGWVVKERNRPARIFVRWESLVIYISSRLTTSGATETEGGV